MGQIWFTSDLHFYHDKEFLYKPRGFDSVWEMNDAIITNWNNVVGANDTVYVLGDLMLNDNVAASKLIKSLKGRLHIICGNHDTETRKQLYGEMYNVDEVVEAKTLKAIGSRFFLCHYPVLCSNYDDVDRPVSRRLISLCGHSHTKDRFIDWDKGLIYHVELDAHNNAPVNIEKIIEELEDRYERTF